MYNRYIIILCIIIIMFTVMSSYKIESFREHFADYINFAQTTVAKDIPKNPNDFSCYKFIKETHPWNIDKYDIHQRHMISAMRNGLRIRKSDLSHNNPYADACVIPREYMSMFGVNSDCKVGNHSLEKSDANSIKPDGCVVDIRNKYKEEKDFVSLLDTLETNFNDKYHKKIAELDAEIGRLEDQKSRLVNEKTRLERDISQAEAKFVDKCDQDLVNFVKSQYEFICWHDQNGNHKCNVHQWLINKFNNLKCSDNNEYVRILRRYIEEIESFWKMYNWWWWYDWWAMYIPYLIDRIDDDLRYFRDNIFGQYNKYL